MKRWVSLLIALILLFGLTGVVSAETTTFQTNCEMLMGAIAEAFDLEYTVTANNDGLTFASMTFNYVQDKIIARDATFQAEITGLHGTQLFATLYSTLELYDKIERSALEVSDDFVILLVLKEDGDDGTITIDQDNRLDMMDKLKKMLIEAGYPEDSSLFDESSESETDQMDDIGEIESEVAETSQPQTNAEQPKTVAALDETDQTESVGDTTPEASETSGAQTLQAQPKTVAAVEAGAGEELPTYDTEESAQTSVASAYPNACDGFDWQGYHLQLTDAYLVSGSDLEDIRSFMDSPDAHYLALNISATDENMQSSDLNSELPYIHLFRLCDRYGNLYEHDALTKYYPGDDQGNRSDEYVKSFELIYEVGADAKPEDFVLYLAGLTEPELFTFGATFTAPDRQLECEGNTMWLADYDDGSWLDWDDEQIEDSEKPLCLYMVAGNEQLIASPEPISNIKLVDAAGNQYGVRRSIVYQSDSFDMDGTPKLTGFYIVFYIPKDSDFSDYSLTALNEAEDISIPVVAP